MRFTHALTVLAALGLTACGFTSSKELIERRERYEALQVIEQKAEHSSSSRSSSPLEQITPSRYSQVIHWTGIPKATGAEWLNGIETTLVKGNISNGSLYAEIERDQHNGTSWSGIGLYLAKPVTLANGKAYPDERSFGTRLHYLGAVWTGKCGSRHLSPSNSFGLVEGNIADKEFDLTAVPVTTGEDGCSTEVTTINLQELINGDGVFIGASPAQAGFRVSLGVSYDGTLELTKF